MPKKSDASVAPRYRSDGRRVCSAHRTNGELCNAIAMQAQDVCWTHGGAAPQAKRKAQERIDAAADRAAGHLIQWMGDAKVPFNIRLQAARDLLDRAGVGDPKRAELTVALKPFEQDIQGLLVEVGSDDDVMSFGHGTPPALDP